MVAPIALFVYNRPDHTRKTIEALIGNELAPQSRLIVFSDGPRDNKDVLLVEQVRDYISTIRGFESVSIIPSKSNKGLANSIISGVTSVLSEYDKVIVLEDDLVTSPQFLRYMNNSLDFYENDEAVISIHGYIYPVKERLPIISSLRVRIAGVGQPGVGVGRYLNLMEKNYSMSLRGGIY